ncbi:hypothetical protein Tco_0019056 [Tanacetum coccineum]
MVNTSLKKLKRPSYLAALIRLSKKENTATAITEWARGSQAKDTVIVKLKEQIKSLNGNVDENTVKMDMDEIETLNIELEHREQGLVIAALKNELRKLKGKALDNEDTVTHSVDPKVSKDNMEPITPQKC